MFPASPSQALSGPARVLLPLCALLIGVALSAVALAASASAGPRSASTSLTGTLQLTAGSCAGGKVSGTYLRMILPSGGPNGPYMSNSDSRCSDKSFTPLAPGSDGGLRVGSYQPIPSPAFSANGDARAHRITAPAPFYGTSFATATNRVDPQTRTAVPAPRLFLTGSTLSADLRSFSVTWNNQHFNQGAPKPDGSKPGNTRTATGTYDARTGAFTLQWTSQVVGGPFDKFTGQWHLAGRFVPDGGGSAPAGSSGSGTSAAGTPASGSTGAVTQPGVAPASGSSTAPAAAGGSPRSAAAAGTGPVGTAPVAAPATTKTVITQKWRVSVPVIGLATGIALLGIAALVALSVLGRRTSAT